MLVEWCLNEHIVLDLCYGRRSAIHRIKERHLQMPAPLTGATALREAKEARCKTPIPYDSIHIKFEKHQIRVGRKQISVNGGLAGRAPS